MRPLHQLNPLRIAYIKDHVCRLLGRDDLTGLHIADIGCGAGLLTEPLARLGAKIVGLDATPTNIEVAKHHAALNNLAIDYRCQSVENLAETNAGQFDVVTIMEVVEHVDHLPHFIASCSKLLRPGGIMVASTLNRTVKAFLVAIVGAEYIARLLPRGTHHWDKFVKPSELAELWLDNSITIAHMTGVSYNPFSKSWSLSKDLGVNYMMVGQKS